MTPTTTAGGPAAAADQPCRISLADNQVRVHLPFRVDPHRLSAQLLREGYGLAHPVDTPDTQGWGEGFSPNGYYPYWLFPDPEQPDRSCFALYPQPGDVVERGEGRPVGLSLSEVTRERIDRWLPVLAHLAETTGGDTP